MSTYPEHEKLHTIRAKSQAQGEFIDWLASEKSIYLAYYIDDHVMCPHPQSLQSLLAEFHGIDENRLEREKRTMLDEMRKLQELRQKEARREVN